MSTAIIWRGLSVALLLLFVFVAAGAQEFRGSLAGKITDPNGAALPGATVTVKNVETNVEATATTNEEGAYNFPLLQPGKYTLTATSTGFGTAAREGLEVRVADKLTLDVQLQVAGVGDTVSVTAATPVLETGSVSTGTVITSQQISELPLAEGTAYQLATLAPGIAYTGNPQFTGPTSNGNLAAFRSNGATGSNQITLDGSPNYAFEGGVGFSPPSDAVQEFKVQTNQFDAQQGFSAGATVNVAIKSGTNDPHGSLWYFNRDRSRTANNFFSNRAGQERPERTYHRYGGVLGGPIYLPKIYNGHDRTFFLVSYERLKDNIAEPQLFTVPTEKMRRGDFSELIVNRNNIADPANVVIYNPFSGRVSGSNVVRSSFGCDVAANTPVPASCNIIPTNLLNPVALAAVRYYPLPNTTGTANGTQLNFFSNQNRMQNYRAWLARVDHQISQNHRVFGKYYHSFNPEDRQNAFGIVNGFPITQGFEERSNDGGNIDYTATLSSSMVLDVRTGLNRFQQVRRPAATFDPAQLGFAPESVAAMRGYQYFPLFVIRNLDATRNTRSTLGAQRADFTAGRTRPFYMGSFQPTLTQIIGNHTARYGYDLRVLRENFATSGALGGRFTFDGTYTAPASNSSSTLRNVFGRDIASFILGVPTTTVVDNPFDYAVQSIYQGFFAQDDWRVTPKLTLNLGLRYELEGGITERFNRIIRGFDLTTPSPIDAAARAAYTTAYNANPSNFLLTPDQFRVLGGYNFADQSNRAAWDADKSNWQPRAGVAYQLNQKTVLRSGFGIFVAPLQIPAQFASTSDNQATLEPGFFSSTTFLTSTNNGLNVNTLTNPFPGGVGALVSSPGSSLGLLTRVGQDVGVSDFGVVPIDRKNPKFARLVFGLQRELPGQFVVESNYVTAWGYDLQVDRNLNFVPREFLGDVSAATTLAEAQAIDAAANTRLSATIPNPFRNLSALAGTGSPFFSNSTITRAQSLVRFPQFTNAYVQQYNGSNRYHSLQFQANKRFSTGNSLTASYTWSRLRERVNYLSPSDTELEDRISPADRTHRVTLSWVYRLPLGRGRRFGGDMNRLLDAVIGGWQFNGTYEWQSGEPFLFSNPLFYAGDVTQLVSRVGEGDGQGGKYGVDRPAFDTTNFLRLSSFSRRTVPTTLSNLRNQAFLNVNMSVTKNFKLGERKRVQIRAEAINAFNHPYFNVVNLDPNNASFGRTTGQRNNPRDIQLGAKFTF